MIRRFGESARHDTRYKRRAGVYAILPRNGLLLLTHQADPTPELQLPGGGIDPGESPAQALHREVLEETGWKIGAIRRVGAFRRFTYMPEYDLWAEKMCLIYQARPVLEFCSPSEPGHTAIWSDWPTAIQQLGNEGDRHFVKQLWARA